MVHGFRTIFCYAIGDVKHPHHHGYAITKYLLGQIEAGVDAVLTVDLPPEEAFRSAAKLGAFTAAFNISGRPAASIPVGLSKSGLPIGVQLAGHRGDDGLVLSVSRDIEQAVQRTGERAPHFR